MNKYPIVDRLWRSRSARVLLAGGTAIGIAVAAGGCGSSPASNAGRSGSSGAGTAPASAGRTPGTQTPEAGQPGSLPAPRSLSQLCTLGLNVVRQAFGDPSATCTEQTDPSSGTQVYKYTLSSGELDVSETSGVSYQYLASQPGMAAIPKVDGHDACVGDPSGGGEQALVDMGGEYGSIVTLQPKELNGSFNGESLTALGRQLTAASVLAEAF